MNAEIVSNIVDGIVVIVVILALCTDIFNKKRK